MVAMRQAACPLAGNGEGCFAAVLGGSVAGMVVSNGVNSFLSLYNTVLVIRLVLTWFPNTPPVIVSPLRYTHTAKHIVPVAQSCVRPKANGKTSHS
jgi:YggT family protein